MGALVTLVMALASPFLINQWHQSVITQHHLVVEWAVLLCFTKKGACLSMIANQAGKLAVTVAANNSFIFFSVYLG